MIPAIVAKSISKFHGMEPTDLRIIVTHLSEAIAAGKMAVDIPKDELKDPARARFNLLCLGYTINDCEDYYSVGWG